MCVTHPNQVHFLAVLHKVEDFRSYLLPHAPKISEHSELLKCLVDLRVSEIQLERFLMVDLALSHNLLSKPHV